jgi:hypothetical protein
VPKTSIAAALSALPLLLAAPAWACPTVANGNPTPLSFDTAQVALVRQGTTTTFTVSINPQGDSDDFALVLPVPALLARDEIRVLDGEVFARLNGYTGVLQMPDAGCVSAGGGLDGAAEETLDQALDHQPTVLVMGSEGDGIRRLVAEHCDVLARIPMPGGFESLNVSNAAAVALYEAARAQRG